ncbi:hypothetical protein MBLNU457_3781t1 [Dothideomycetes sp. NU457]
MTGSLFSPQLLTLVSLSSTVLASQNLPYNPTRIFIPANQDDASYAYVIQPGSDSTTSAQLSSIDLTQTLEASSLSLNVLSSNLPFLSSSSSAYAPILDSSGNITVLAGDCTKGASGVALWRFQPNSKAKDGQGTWTQDQVSTSLAPSNNAVAANYLNGGVAWSEIVNGNASNIDMYVFGGMCPTSGATQNTWQSAASYSNLMMTMTPESATATDVDYRLALLTSSGPPIAEAGFSITGLSPTFSNASGIETQQQSFVLLGGHTQQAFINMSQVALYSLPQGAWSYLPITQSSSGAVQVTPRSGHTAVLSEDGSSVVVYGGWVGDVNTPATPQLAVLKVGTGYGGLGNWYWSTPSASGGSAPTASGIYGHGAVMLPGNIMMIMGGYTISAPSTSSRLTRRASSTTNSQALFYNVTSNAWISSYSPQATDSSGNKNMLQDSTGGLTTTAQKAGLGVGLTIAIVLVVGLAIFCFMYFYKRRTQRRGRDGHVLMSEKLSFDEAWRHTDDTDGHSEIPIGHYEEANSSKEAFPWLPEVAASAGWKKQHANSRDGGSTGAFVDIPSPTRGLRKGSIARSTYQYQAAPDGRTSRASVGIHPIEEQDEESSVGGTPRLGTADAERRLKAIQEIFRDDGTRNTHPDDPFRDPELNPLGSHPVSPDPEYNIRRAPTNSSVAPSVFGNKSVSVGTDQIATWVNQWSGKNAQQELHSYNGRVSPSKSIDDRTSSTLSEQSNRSDLSARSIARTTSTRSHAFFGLAGAPRISPLHSPIEEKFPHLFGPGRASPPRDAHRGRSVTAPTNQLKRQGDGSVPTFTQLREEADALLGAEATNSGRRRPLHRRTSSSYSQETSTMASSALPPSTSLSQVRRNAGWMGSIRRVLSGSIHDRSPEIDTFPLSGNSQPAYSPYRDRSASPAKRNSTAPRRTASDGSTFLRTKRGKEDWTADSEGNAWEPYRDEPDTGDWGQAGPISPPSQQEQFKKTEADVDWDIERAAATRDVQVMFTMPKARLRVVNPDDDKSTRSVSEGGISRRSNSNKSKHERETTERK